MNEELNYQVHTIYKDTTKEFHTLTEALIYLDGLEEAAALWDFTGESAEMIKCNF